MTISILTGRKGPQKIGVIELDATIRENHVFRNVVTNYPVEEGFDITDHVRQEPENINIVGFISNTPVLPRDNISGEFQIRENLSNKVQLVFNELLRISGRRISNIKEGTTIQITDAQLVDVVTILQVYTNMIIVNLTFLVDKYGSNAQRFQVTLKRLEKVQSDITVLQNISNLNGKAENAENQGAEKEKKGKQDKKEIKPSMVEKLLQKLEEKIGKKTE